MMLPMRISVSVTPPPWACCADIGTANSAAARREIESLICVGFFMTSPQPAKRACDPSPQPQQYARNRVVEIKCWARFENRTAARPSTQIDIQPPQRVDGDAVAAV